MTDVYKKSEMFKQRLSEAACALPQLEPLLKDAAAMSGLAAASNHDKDVCRKVFELCRPYMNLAAETEAEEWLQGLYTKLCARMFPEEENKASQETAQFPQSDEELYLAALELLIDEGAGEFDPLSDVIRIEPEWVEGSRVKAQYAKFEEAVRDAHFMALLYIGREIQSFDPASHTIGVHNVALHTAIMAQKAGFEVDLPLVSASALGHDIGKFGCRGDDAKRIPYLHYYYTWQWFSENDMQDIGHVAANHSTWDLEFENLPIESLLLIYADFRVRGSRDESGREKVVIYSLADSYKIIFSKLADMTPEKQRRYKSVYLKLRDFERLLESRGVPSEIETDELLSVKTKDASLMGPEEALQALRSMTLSGSIRLMRMVSIDKSFEQLLEQAKSEKNLQKIRTYLFLLREYSTYMTKANKQKTLLLLYELLMHQDDDVRRTAARIMGRILANSGPKYRKERPRSAKNGAMTPTMMALLSEAAELWSYYIEICLHPDPKISPRHASRITSSLNFICKSLFEVCDEKDAPKLVEALLEKVFSGERADRFVLIEVLCNVPPKYLPEDKLQSILDLLENTLKEGDVALNLIALRCLKQLQQLPGMDERVKAVLENYKISEIEYFDILFYQKRKMQGLSVYQMNEGRIAELHLSDLKNAVHWTVKLAQMEIICDNTKKYPQQMFHTAMHFSNLLSVSEHLQVRQAAGENLLKIAPFLTKDQINEISIDLMRELETGQEQIAHFIPPYLGRLMCMLSEKELSESIAYLEELARSTSVRSARSALYTLAEVLNFLPENDEKMTEHILGIIMTGISHYDDMVHQTALRVLCKNVFGKTMLSMERRHDIFVKTYKKLLTLLSEPRQDRLTFFNCAAMLNHLYRYIVKYETSYGDFRFPKQKPAAFFPGTFDPFSVGHKQIVQEIEKMGFEVYLAVDEFSWSKKTLPKLLRRKIVSISVADQLEACIFPDDIPINIASEEDLGRLKRLFSGRELYLVAGSDVIRNASAYKSEKSGSAADYNHIIFWRNGGESGDMADICAIIRGKLKMLSLPPFYESVSSTRIRESVDQKLDISMLVDPVVQSFIYENGLYMRSSERKNVLERQEFFFKSFKRSSQRLPQSANECLNQHSASTAYALYMRPEIMQGWVAGHTILIDDLYYALGSMEAADYVRRHASGRILFVDDIGHEYEAGSPSEQITEVYRMLLNEILARSLKGGHTYALCRCGNGGDELRSALRQMGFVPVDEKEDIFYVDMRSPVLLLLDVMLCIKKPYRDSEAVKKTVMHTRPKLRATLNSIFPGRLLLCFDSEMLNQTLMEKIEIMNGVQDVPRGQRRLGPYMCVPYGKIFSDEVVPNTVTKTLHVEKCIRQDLDGFEISEYPGYSPLRNQVRTLKSFKRPMILVDDLLHKGYRIEKLDKIFRSENTGIDKILVAVMSGSGRDLMRVQRRNAECEYFIPNLHYWITESLLYPFIGGDSSSSNNVKEHMLLSLNMILPYAYPKFFLEGDMEKVRNLSQTSLENAFDILSVLEREHQRIYSTALSIRRLGEALGYPRLPDKGNYMIYDYSLLASTYIEQDLALMKRICREKGGSYGV